MRGRVDTNRGSKMEQVRARRVKILDMSVPEGSEEPEAQSPRDERRNSPLLTGVLAHFISNRGIG